MDEAFLDSAPKDELHALMARRDHPALARFAVQFGLLVAASALVVLGPELALPLWSRWLGVVVFALMCMAMFAIMHESAHGAAFASRRLNRVVCWLASVPYYYTPTGFREFHFTHHRHTHDPNEDPEISVGGKPAPSVTGSLGMYLAFVSGLPLIFFKLGVLVAASLGGPPAVWSGLLRFVAPRARRRLSWEARAVLALHVAWVVAGALWLPGLLMLLVGQLLGHLFLACYLIAEHQGRPHEGDVLARTRTTRAGPVLRWLMWNMPYHAEHHAYPAVPWHALPRLHALLAAPGGSPWPAARGYLALHRAVWADLLKRHPFKEVI